MTSLRGWGKLITLSLSFQIQPPPLHCPGPFQHSSLPCQPRDVWGCCAGESIPQRRPRPVCKLGQHQERVNQTPHSLCPPVPPHRACPSEDYKCSKDCQALWRLVYGRCITSVIHGDLRAAEIGHRCFCFREIFNKSQVYPKKKYKSESQTFQHRSAAPNLPITEVQQCPAQDMLPPLYNFHTFCKIFFFFFPIAFF